MAITYQCTTCIALSLVSTVKVRAVTKNVIKTRAFFDTDGSFVKPVIKQQVVTFCSQGHEVINEFNKLPDELIERIDEILDPT